MSETIQRFDETENQGIAMRLDYGQSSQVIGQAQQNHVALFSQLNREDVTFTAQIKQPLLFRDSLLALFEIVSSDYRYVPKDRSMYTAFLQMRRSSQNSNLFAAQKAYFDWLYNNDPLAYCILDPIIQVHQHGVTFEVFSKDEGCYAQLTLKNHLFSQQQPAKFGTTHIDYSQSLFKGIEQIRSYQNTHLSIGQQAVSLHSEKEIGDEVHVLEKRINVPKSWIRALLQVQSASQLSQDNFELDPLALYNILFELRMNADIKGKKRGLIIELVPQKPPVLTLEPFGIVIHSQSKVYQGKQAKLIRLWGRRRLSLLKRLLPYTKTVKVTLLGQGMPSYWTLASDDFELTFAMTGFSQANWSQALNFDLLLPKRPLGDENVDLLSQLLHQLQQNPGNGKSLAKALNLKINQLNPLLLQASQQGLLRFDMVNDCYFYRPLSDSPLPLADFAFHNLAEKQAYDLLSRKAIKKLQINFLPTQGVQLSADIVVDEDRRTYHSQLQLNDEGMVSRAECSCPKFLQHRLTQGVCSHLVALRLAYAQTDGRHDKNRWQEVRVFSKRRDDSLFGNQTTEQVQIQLQQKKVIIERIGSQNSRQQWLFNRPEQAYTAFLNQIDQLQQHGFLENQVM